MKVYEVSYIDGCTGDHLRSWFSNKVDAEGEVGRLMADSETPIAEQVFGIRVLNVPKRKNELLAFLNRYCCMSVILLCVGVAQAEWIVENMEITAYCGGKCCCQKWADGITASGHKLKPGDKVVAAPKRFAFNTPMYVPGYGFTSVQDRGGAIKGNRLDLWFPSHKEALIWGRQKNVTVVWWKKVNK